VWLGRIALVVGLVNALIGFSLLHADVWWELAFAFVALSVYLSAAAIEFRRRQSRKRTHAFADSYLPNTIPRFLLGPHSDESDDDDGGAK
jgi:membrane protein implicated in regulation of membrane protease activity